MKNATPSPGGNNRQTFVRNEHTQNEANTPSVTGKTKMYRTLHGTVITETAGNTPAGAGVKCKTWNVSSSYSKNTIIEVTGSQIVKYIDNQTSTKFLYCYPGTYISTKAVPTNGMDTTGSLTIPTWPEPSTRYWHHIRFAPNTMSVCINSVQTTFFVQAWKSGSFDATCHVTKSS